MVELSQKSQELLKFMRDNYIEEGYMYSGSWPYSTLKERGYDKDTIHELQAAGKIQKRDCDEYAFELSVSERGALISDHNLGSVWYEKNGHVMLPEIQQEVRLAAEIPVDKETRKVTVSTLKVVRDNAKPDKMNVACPFSVGQVISLEYDLPKKLGMRKVGYADYQNASPGRRVGQFMVTNIVHNMLVDPQMNMLEIQSLSDEFNKLYPLERTMMVFEDVILKRIKNKTPSLSDQIHSASTRAAGTCSDNKSPSVSQLPHR